MPVTPTYDLIASNVLSSSASSVTFSSIPATYRDLVWVVDAKHADSGWRGLIRVNNNSGANYNFVFAKGDGSTATSASYAGETEFNPEIELTNTTASLVVAQFMDYSQTDKHKTVFFRVNRANAATVMTAGRWASTAAINQIDFFPASGNIASGSSFYLYGIAS